MNAIDETKLNAIGMRYYRSTHPRSRRSNATAIGSSLLSYFSP